MHAMAVSAKNIPAPDLVPVKRALISVSDKSGIVDFARALAGKGVELVSTGGTSAALAKEGLAVRDVSELTGFPEIMDGRVKTLHPSVHGALLGIRDDAEHKAAMEEHGIPAIDLAVINLYPFEEVRFGGGDYAATVENIDIGGPAMLRAAAKNHAYVAVVTDPADYERVLAALEENDGALPHRLRQELAAKAYARTAAYDAAISQRLAETLSVSQPEWRAVGGRLASGRQSTREEWLFAPVLVQGERSGVKGVLSHAAGS
jgi:phosphoribosylaminoimidazolecarboxamide formyltransferase / IMP cyclohydrolase